MSAYLSSIVTAAGIVTLASLLVPEGKNKRWVNFVFSLLAFSVIAAPLLRLQTEPGLSSFDDTSLSQDSPDSGAAGEAAGDVVISAAQETLARGLAERLKILPESVAVEISANCEGGLWEITKITARIGVPFHEKSAYAYLNEVAPKDCEVTVLGG